MEKQNKKEKIQEAINNVFRQIEEKRGVKIRVVETRRVKWKDGKRPEV